MRLFAEQGYRATTVGQIEEAAGLSPRAGGLYKHFASKRDLFEAGIQRHTREMDRITSMAKLLPYKDLRSDMTLAARLALGELAAEREMMMILQRDGRDFPEFQQIARERVVNPGFAEAEVLIRRWIGDKGGPEVRAMSAVLFSSLVNFRVLEVMLGEHPAGVSEEDFVEAWVDLAARYISSVLGNTEEEAKE